MKIKITYKNKILSNNIEVAESFSSRLIGLMFKEKFENADGLMIDPCRSIHTCFMKYPLDIVFLSKEDKVVKIVRCLQPWRMTWIYYRAKKTLEMPAGKLPLDLFEGDSLEVTSV